MYHTVASSNEDLSNYGMYYSFLSARAQNYSTGDFSLK